MSEKNKWSKGYLTLIIITEFGGKKSEVKLTYVVFKQNGIIKSIVGRLK